MMFKKEYLILFAVIIGACLYLYVKDRDRMNYRLPELAPVEKADIVTIEINRSQPEALLMEKLDGQWRVSAAGYPADESQAKKMLEALSDMTLTALVSDSGDYDRYDLDKEKAILVTARSGDNTVVRELAVGKRAASGHHTFVRVGNDPFVYHAGGSLRDIFDKTVDALRDKTVLAFDKEAIQRISITTDGETLDLEKQPVSAAAPDAAVSGEKEPADEQKMIWKTSDGQPVDQSAIGELLGALSSLKCGGYLPEGAEKALTNPAYKVALTGEQAYTLSLFPLSNEDESGYAGLSSENRSAFSLPDYQAGRIMKKPSELLTPAAAAK